MRVTAKLKTGTSQGGVGSPTWFNYNQDKLLEELSRSPARETSFADDLFFAVRGHCKIACRKRAQEGIEIAVKWAQETGMEFSPKKTQVMFLTRKRGDNAKPPGHLTLYGQELKYVKEVDYLGIKIDSKLSWKTHLENKIMNYLISVPMMSM